MALRSVAMTVAHWAAWTAENLAARTVDSKVDQWVANLAERRVGHWAAWTVGQLAENWADSWAAASVDWMAASWADLRVALRAAL